MMRPTPGLMGIPNCVGSRFLVLYIEDFVFNPSPIKEVLEVVVTSLEPTHSRQQGQ